MRSQILTYGEQQHQVVQSTQTKLEIVAGADETFFPGFDGIILVVSDRAKALIELAVKGIGCQSIPDLFHAMRCLSRSIGVRLGAKLARIKKKLRKTQKEIILRHLNQKPISEKLNKRRLILQQEYQFIQTGLDTYREYIHQISTLVHPF